MVGLSHQMKRVHTVGHDFVYQNTSDFDPKSPAFCPYCWEKRRVKVALPPAGESGYTVCHECRTAAQLQIPIDFDFYYALED